MRSRAWSSAATRAAASSAIRPPTSTSAITSGRKYGIYAVRVTLDDGSRASRRRQPRRPPDLRSAAGAARGASVRLRRRPLRPQDRGRAPRLHPRGEEVRRRRRPRRPHARGRGERRGSCWRSPRSSPERGGGSRRLTEGAHVSAARPWAPSTIHSSVNGPPPRSGEELARFAFPRNRPAKAAPQWPTPPTPPSPITDRPSSCRGPTFR